MSSTERAEPVLPASRQPMPDSEVLARDRRDGDAGEKRRRSVAEIEAEIEATTERLATTVDALVDRLSPKQVVRRRVADVKGLVVTPDGRPRPEVVGAVLGALVGAAVLVWLARRNR